MKTLGSPDSFSSLFRSDSEAEGLWGEETAVQHVDKHTLTRINQPHAMCW